MLVSTCNFSIWKAEAGGWAVQDRCRVHVVLSQAVTKYETKQNIHTREKWAITKSIKSKTRPLCPFPENSVVSLEFSHTDTELLRDGMC